MATRLYRNFENSLGIFTYSPHDYCVRLTTCLGQQADRTTREPKVALLIAHPNFFIFHDISFFGKKLCLATPFSRLAKILFLSTFFVKVTKQFGLHLPFNSTWPCCENLNNKECSSFTVVILN